MSFDPTQVLIETQREEIIFLRAQNKELTERVMAFSGHAYQAYLARDLSKVEIPPPSFVDEISGQIVKMDASTKEEEEQKNQALEQIGQILGA